MASTITVYRYRKYNMYINIYIYAYIYIHNGMICTDNGIIRSK